MSYNISHIETPVLEAWIYAADVVRLIRNQKYLPSSNFLHDLYDDAVSACADVESHGAHTQMPITRFSWSGEGSGHDYNATLLPHIVPYIHGTIEAIVFWVGGDEVTGLLIKDGRAVECKVEQRLVKPEGWE